MSSCSCCLSPFPLIFQNGLVSSAHFNSLLVTTPSRSLMYIKNKTAPSKGSFYIAQYPVRWTAQSDLHFLPPLADLFIPTDSYTMGF